MSRLPLVLAALVLLGRALDTGRPGRHLPLRPAARQLRRLPTTDNSLDQLPLYSGLTRCGANVSRDDIERLFLPMDFKPFGAARVEDTPNDDVTITYDSYGIPHIKGRTRAGLMYGAGWVMARDRNLLFTFGRNPARAAVADIPGLDAFSLVTSATPFEPSPTAEALVTAQQDHIVRRYGAEGRQMLRDFEDYAAGINAFYEAPGGPDPPATPFNANDVIAVTAFIGSIFGAGGGSEHRNSDLLAKLEGPRRARRTGGVERRHALRRRGVADHDAPALLLRPAHRRAGPRLGGARPRLDRARSRPAEPRRDPHQGGAPPTDVQLAAGLARTLG